MIADRRWKDLISEHDAIDTAAQNATSDGPIPVAVYTLKTGEHAYFRATPETNGSSTLISADRNIVEDSARRQGNAARLGISLVAEAIK